MLSSIGETNIAWKSLSAPNLGQIPVSERAITPKKVVSQHESIFEPFGSDGLSFLDILDMVNPLHHIPVIGTLYREISGDKIAPIARITGGSIFFGPIGFIGSTLNVLIEEITGKDLQSHFNFVFKTQNKTEITSRNSTNQLTASTIPSSSTLVNHNLSSIDPVSDWAQKELAIRKAELLKVERSNMPDKSEYAANIDSNQEKQKPSPSETPYHVIPQKTYNPSRIKGVAAYKKQIANNHLEALTTYQRTLNSVSILK